MAGVVRTVPSHSSRSAPRGVKAPRPPNAWIIYRSDKAHQLPPLEPGQPRRAQAEVSKMISNMWASEPEETRQEYERRAEEAKAAHALKYPGYRFKPMKKEERRAQREQERDQRQAKRRDRHPSGGSPDRASMPPAPLTPIVPQYYASVHMPMNLPQLSHPLPPALPYPVMPFYSSQTRFGPAGPTPPVSAAASPSDPGSPSSPEATPTADKPQNASENIDPSLTTTVINSNNTIQVRDDPAPCTIGVLEPTLYPQSFNTPAFASGQEWPHASAATISNGGTLTPALTPSPLWQEVDSSQQQQTIPVTNQAEHVSFDLGPFHLQNLDNVISGSNDESLSAFLNATNDPSIFRLTQLEPSRLLSNPNGEIEVSLGEFPPLDLSLFPPELFNFSEPFALGFPQADCTAPQESFLFNPGIAVGSTGGSPQRTDDSLNMGYNPDDYLDFGTSTNELPTLVATSYVPPAGAANSSHRRAAGSWSKQFVRSQTPSPPRLTQAQ